MASKKHRMTIQDLAKDLGLSKATISRYLNGKYEYMSEETRQRIAQKIAETGYRPNRVAGSLKTLKSNMVGLVLSDATSTLTPFLVGSICDSCAKHGHQLLIVASRNDEERERTQVQMLLDQQVDGLIVTTGSNLEFYRGISKELPVVLVDRIPSGSMMDSFAINHEESTSIVVNHLIDSGYTKIIVLTRTNRSAYSTLTVREDVARRTCLTRFGDANHCEIISINGGMISDSSENDRTIPDLLEEARRQSERENVAFFLADATLMGRVIGSCYLAGIQLSSRFTIAGYDSLNTSTTLLSQICVIRQPLASLGSMAAQRLMQVMQEEEPSATIMQYLRCEISLPNA